jgi:hypothetical protein
MTAYGEIERTAKKIAENAAEIKKNIAEGALKESFVLVGKQVELVEMLRKFGDVKVSEMNSDIRNEMDFLIRKAQSDISDAIGQVNARLAALSKELANTRGARKIVAYKVQVKAQDAASQQGGCHGYKPG